MTTTRTMLISGAAILAMIAVRGAEKPAAKFTELQRRDIPGTGLEGVTTMAEIPPEWYGFDQPALEKMLEHLLRRKKLVKDLIVSSWKSSVEPFPNWK